LIVAVRQPIAKPNRHDARHCRPLGEAEAVLTLNLFWALV